jgi:hypothetical protein
VAECPHPADDNPVVSVSGDVLEAAKVGLVGVDGKCIGQNLNPPAEHRPGLTVQGVKLVGDIAAALSKTYHYDFHHPPR